MARLLQMWLVGAGTMAAVAIADAADDPRPTSDHISSVIAGGLPKFEPTKGAADSTHGSARTSASTIAGITRLPAFVVRQERIPTDDQVLTYKGRAKIAMDKYLGPADGLDRGVLNRFTLVQLWKKIPILGTLRFVGTPVGMSNEDRGFDAGGANDTIPYPHPPPKEKE